MTDKVTIFYQVDSCESCHFSQREQYAHFRCKQDTSIEFVQNRDMGVPPNCPFRTRKP
jgi:hypothetical protein